MESEDSDVCLTKSRGPHASPRIARQRDHAEFDFHQNDDIGGASGVSYQRSEGFCLNESPQQTTRDRRQVQQHQSPRREFLLRQLQAGAAAASVDQEAGPVWVRSLVLDHCLTM